MLQKNAYIKFIDERIPAEMLDFFIKKPIDCSL